MTIELHYSHLAATKCGYHEVETKSGKTIKYTRIFEEGTEIPKIDGLVKAGEVDDASELEDAVFKQRIGDTPFLRGCVIE